MNLVALHGGEAVTGTGINPRRVGHVYIIESTDGATVKIGCSRRPEKRISAVKTQANAGGRTWVSPRQADCHALERRAHLIAKDSRQIGEWFAIGFDDAVVLVSQILGRVISDDEMHDAREKRRASEDASYGEYLEKIYPRQNQEQKEMQEAFTLAKRAQEMVLLHREAIPKECVPSQDFGGISEFELLVGIYLSDVDRVCIASLFHDACEASLSDLMFDSLMSDMRGCAMVDAMKDGLPVPKRYATQQQAVI